MDTKLFTEQLQVKIISILQEKLTSEAITSQRAGEIADVALSYLYPTMEKEHLLLAKEEFLKYPELQSIVNEIETQIAQ